MCRRLQADILGLDRVYTQDVMNYICVYDSVEVTGSCCNFGRMLYFLVHVEISSKCFKKATGLA